MLQLYLINFRDFDCSLPYQERDICGQLHDFSRMLECAYTSNCTVWRVATNAGWKVIHQRLFFFLRSPWHGLPSVSSCPIHKLLLWLSAIPGLLRRHGNTMSRLALLWHRRSPGNVPVSQRHPVLSSSVCLWLVVQRQMRSQPGFICNQQSALRNT